MVCESVNYAHRLLQGTIKLVDQILGVRRKKREKSVQSEHMGGKGGERSRERFL